MRKRLIVLIVVLLILSTVGIVQLSNWDERKHSFASLPSTGYLTCVSFENLELESYFITIDGIKHYLPHGYFVIAFDEKLAKEINWVGAQSFYPIHVGINITERQFRHMPQKVVKLTSL